LEVKGSPWVGLTTFPPSCAEILEILGTRRPENTRACPGL